MTVKEAEYYNLLGRYYKAEKWFCKQEDSYFDNIEMQKEYRAFMGIVERLRILYEEIKTTK